MKSLPAIVVLIVVGAAAYYYFQLDKPGQQQPQTVTTEPLQIPQDAEPEIKHPVTEPAVIIDSASGDDAGESSTEAEKEPPLPLLEDSDSRIKEIILGIFDNDLVDQILRQTGIIHRFVVTIDSLPRKSVPVKYRLLPPTPGEFLVDKDSSDKITLSPENYARYERYIELLEKLDTDQFVRWYTRFYPLIQQDYDSLGYKNSYFNDRFIFVIDHLLQSPGVTGSIELVQPNVFYNFADPALQKLSAGQKILLRIGSANAAIVKAKLGEIREKLATPE